MAALLVVAHREAEDQRRQSAIFAHPEVLLMEAALRASAVEWVSVRLPHIVPGPDKPLRVSATGRGIGLSITAGSAARFLLEQALSDQYLRSTPCIGQ